MPDPNLAWLDAVSRLASTTETTPETLLMRQIDAFEAEVKGPARRFAEIASGAEPIHRLALAKRLVGGDATVTYEEFGCATTRSWATARRDAHGSVLMDTSRSGLRLCERVEEILLGFPVAEPLPLPEVRPEVAEAAARVKAKVEPGPLAFHSGAREFCLEYARAWSGDALTAWSMDFKASGAWAHLQADDPFLWLDFLAPWAQPAVDAAPLVGCPPSPEADRMGRDGVLLDPLFARLNGDNAGPSCSDDEDAPHLSSYAWTTPTEGLDALVLPDEQHRALLAVAERARAGGRCVVLLHGPPGTGKSLAARCLAATLGRRVYALDGSRMRGMFVGQLERRVGGVMERLGEDVLVIDEADTWFGRREGSAGSLSGSNVREVTTMLLMLERLKGVAVLTTNRLETLDPALWRRVDLVLVMPTPGPMERMALWGRVAPSVRPSTLAVLASLELTGGDIDAAASEAALRGTSEPELVAAARRRAEQRRLLG
jgi:hypothetical protein